MAESHVDPMTQVESPAIPQSHSQSSREEKSNQGSSYWKKKRDHGRSGGGNHGLTLDDLTYKFGSTGSLASPKESPRIPPASSLRNSSSGLSSIASVTTAPDAYVVSDIPTKSHGNQQKNNGEATFSSSDGRGKKMDKRNKNDRDRGRNHHDRERERERDPEREKEKDKNFGWFPRGGNQGESYPKNAPNGSTKESSFLTSIGIKPTEARGEAPKETKTMERLPEKPVVQIKSEEITTKYYQKMVNAQWGDLVM